MPITLHMNLREIIINVHFQTRLILTIRKVIGHHQHQTTIPSIIQLSLNSLKHSQLKQFFIKLHISIKTIKLVKSMVFLPNYESTHQLVTKYHNKNMCLLEHQIMNMKIINLFYRNQH